MGIHWRFDATAGVEAGNSVANNIFNRLLQPLAIPLPAGASKSLLVDYLTTDLRLTLMQLGDGVDRETVMLDSRSVRKTTVYTVSALWNAPSIFGKKGRGSLTVYVVGANVCPGNSHNWLHDFFHDASQNLI